MNTIECLPKYPALSAVDAELRPFSSCPLNCCRASGDISHRVTAITGFGGLGLCGAGLLAREPSAHGVILGIGGAFAVIAGLTFLYSKVDSQNKLVDRVQQAANQVGKKTQLFEEVISDFQPLVENLRNADENLNGTVVKFREITDNLNTCSGNFEVVINEAMVVTQKLGERETELLVIQQKELQTLTEKCEKQSKELEQINSNYSKLKKLLIIKNAQIKALKEEKDDKDSAPAKSHGKRLTT